jgi:hypothetical protein
MSLGGNLSSGYTSQLTDKAIYSGITKSVSIAYSNACCNNSGSGKNTTASQSSMVILSNPCPSPTPAEFALYPKVAVPSSVRLQQVTSSCFLPLDPNTRFSKYQRYQVPVPCPPLNQSANLAGKSLPSSLECNIYPNT